MSKTGTHWWRWIGRYFALFKVPEIHPVPNSHFEWVSWCFHKGRGQRLSDSTKWQKQLCVASRDQKSLHHVTISGRSCALWFCFCVWSESCYSRISWWEPRVQETRWVCPWSGKKAQRINLHVLRAVIKESILHWKVSFGIIRLTRSTVFGLMSVISK